MDECQMGECSMPVEAERLLRWSGCGHRYKTFRLCSEHGVVGKRAPGPSPCFTCGKVSPLEISR